MKSWLFRFRDREYRVSELQNEEYDQNWLRTAANCSAAEPMLLAIASPASLLDNYAPFCLCRYNSRK
jgi:hypothetical protein